MASGKEHDRSIWLGTAMLAGILFGMTGTKTILLGSKIGFNLSIPQITAICLGHLIGGLLFSPDLDTDSIPYHRWGLFKIIWYPYQRLFKHRSPFTHGIGIGSVIRVVYFIFALWLVVQCLISTVAIVGGNQEVLLLGIALGICYVLRKNLVSLVIIAVVIYFIKDTPPVIMLLKLIVGILQPFLKGLRISLDYRDYLRNPLFLYYFIGLEISLWNHLLLDGILLNVSNGKCYVGGYNLRGVVGGK